VVTAIQRAEGDDSPRPKALALMNAIANVLYVSPNFPAIINWRTDLWYQQMNNVLTLMSVVKGFINIPIAAYGAAAAGWAKGSAFVETGMNVLWNVPVIANIIVNKDNVDTTYPTLVPESIGNFFFNLGGMLEFPIAISTDVRLKALLSELQYGFMFEYGAFTVIAGAENEWPH